MKKLLILLLCCCFGQLLLAQMTVDLSIKNYHYFQKQLKTSPQNIHFTQQIQSLNIIAYQNNNFHLPTTQQLPVPLAYAYKDLAFFCKIEVDLEKSVKLPVKFRLGSVDYVDYLEGKRDRY